METRQQQDKGSQNDDFLICPKCGGNTKNLIRHFMGDHPEYGVKNKTDIQNAFPEYKGRFHIDNRKIGDYICPICDTHFDYKNGLQVHIKNLHADQYYLYKRKDTRSCAHLQCPICKKMYSDIKQHINGTHNMDWSIFCREYDWDIKLTKNITEEYRKNLSINKKNFYRETGRGKELRKNQSARWKDDNPANHSDIKEKSINSRAVHGKLPALSGRGICIKYKGIRFRSYNEFCFYIICRNNGITIEYEPTGFLIKYWNEGKKFYSTYIPDFYIPEIGVMELKSNKGDKEYCLSHDNKYAKVSDVYGGLNIPYHICTFREALDLLGVEINQYEVRELARGEILSNLDSVHIWCKQNSKTIKDIFDDQFNTQNKNLTII